MRERLHAILSYCMKGGQKNRKTAKQDRNDYTP